MNKLVVIHRVIGCFFKGLLLTSFLFSSLHALELKPIKQGTTFQTSRSFIGLDHQMKADSRVLDCPQGYNHSGILNVCVAENLSLNVVSELSTDNRCQRSFEKLTGTRFCTRKNHFFSASEKLYFIGGEYKNYCPENYSRPPESDICVEKSLSLIEFNGELKLVAPSGGAIVPPDEAVGLSALPPKECEPGFIKPPGFHFCISNNLANIAEPKLYEFEIPVGSCPDNWSRKIDDGFCLPENYLHICGADFPCKVEVGDSFRILREPLSCPEGFIYQQINIPTRSHSAVDSFAIIPVYACVPPDKF